MKGLLKTFAMVGLLAGLGACLAYTTIAERDTYVSQPKWYAKQCFLQVAKVGFGGRKITFMSRIVTKRITRKLRRTDVCYCNEQLCKTYQR